LPSRLVRDHAEAMALRHVEPPVPDGDAVFGIVVSINVRRGNPHAFAKLWLNGRTDMDARRCYDVATPRIITCMRHVPGPADIPDRSHR
jgi:hypothetical protein